MPSAAALRSHLQQVLAPRIPGALEHRPPAERERVPSGVAALDALLGGGVPVGAISELVGPEGSGRTTATLGILAGLTAAGKVCAWIDVADAFDPESAAGAGVDLRRLLWVRCGSAAAAARPAGVQVRSEILESLASVGKPVGPGHCGGGSMHPRNETRGMSQAVESLLTGGGAAGRRPRGVGTPGMANRPVEGVGEPAAVKPHPVAKCQKGVSSRARTVARQEQVPFDRLPPRRGEMVAQRVCSAGVTGKQIGSGHDTQVQQVGGEATAPPVRKSWSTRDGGALDQALRAADLLLQAGGFSAIVLDLGSTPAEFAWRIPLATWFRFRAGCDRARTSLVLLTQYTCARSSAEVVVRMLPGEVVADGRVLAGVRFQAELERRRFPGSGEASMAEAEGARLQRMPEKVVSIRKPPAGERGERQQPGGWRTAMSWMRGRRA